MIPKGWSVIAGSITLWIKVQKINDLAVLIPFAGSVYGIQYIPK